MPTNPFETLRERETPTSSFRWYQDMIRKLGLNNIQPQKVMQSGIGEFVTQVQPGSMYLFRYDPKTAETLPYYDTAPLTMVFRVVPGGFYGLNFHYLPPLLRMQLLNQLMEINEGKFTKTTRLRLSWRLLNTASNFPAVQPCVKQYLFDHVASRIMKIYPTDWRKSIMLPIEDFQKASKNKVFTDSRRRI
jgi:hypothetical protein